MSDCDRADIAPGAEKQEGFDLPSSPVLTKQNWSHALSHV
jgi:hypothetical protein